MKKSVLYVAAALLAGSFFASAEAQTIQTYTVNWTDTPPTVDGQRGTGEWDDAEAATGNFRLLRTAAPGDPSPENLSFQAVWSDDAFYLIVESDFTGWSGTEFDGDNDNVNFSETLEIFLDPNRDGEANVTDADSANPDSDSYQIQISVLDNNNDVRAGGDPGPPYFSAGARYNALFGNTVTSDATPDTAWTPTAASIARNTTAGNGVFEYRIPFNILDAVDSENSGMDASGGPANDDIWLFNIARISSTGDLPLWNYHEAAGTTAFFAERPHGEITFVGQPAPTEVKEFMLYK